MNCFVRIISFKSLWTIPLIKKFWSRTEYKETSGWSRKYLNIKTNKHESPYQGCSLWQSWNQHHQDSSRKPYEDQYLQPLPAIPKKSAEYGCNELQKEVIVPLFTRCVSVEHNVYQYNLVHAWLQTRQHPINATMKYEI